MFSMRNGLTRFAAVAMAFCAPLYALRLSVEDG